MAADFPLHSSFKDWVTSSKKEQQKWLEMLGDRSCDFIEFIDLDTLHCKVGFSLFGYPPYNEETKTISYSEEQDCHIMKIISKIHEASRQISDSGIFLSVIFIYCFLIDNKSNHNYLDVVFKIRNKIAKQEKFIDSNSRLYDSWELFKTNNKYPKCWYLLPNNGKYIRDSNGNVMLELEQSPANSTLSKIGNIFDTGSLLVGLGGAAVAISSIFVPVAAPIMLGAVVTGGVGGVYSLGRSVNTLIDRHKHGQSIKITDREAIGIWIDVILSAATVGMSAGPMYSAVTKMTAASGEAVVSVTNATKGGQAVAKASRGGRAAARAAARVAKSGTQVGKSAAVVGQEAVKASGIAKNAANVGKKAIKVANKAAKITKTAATVNTAASHATKIATDIGKNTANIAGKTAKAAKGASNIAKTAKAVQVATDISKNTANIAGKTAKAAKGASNIAKTAKAAKVATDIGKNTANIAGTTAKAARGASNIAKTAKAAKVATDIGKNTANVVGTAAKAAKGASNIAKTAKAAKVATDIGKNTANVAGTTAKAARGASNIAKTAKAAKVATDIGKNTANVAGTVKNIGKTAKVAKSATQVASSTKVVTEVAKSTVSTGDEFIKSYSTAVSQLAKLMVGTVGSATGAGVTNICDNMPIDLQDLARQVIHDGLNFLVNIVLENLTSDICPKTKEFLKQILIIFERLTSRVITDEDCQNFQLFVKFYYNLEILNCKEFLYQFILQLEKSTSNVKNNTKRELVPLMATDDTFYYKSSINGEEILNETFSALEHAKISPPTTLAHVISLTHSDGDNVNQPANHGHRLEIGELDNAIADVVKPCEMECLPEELQYQEPLVSDTDSDWETEYEED